MTSITNWLKQYWFLITFLFSASVAYGQMQTKVTTLEEAVKQTVVTQTEIKDLKIQSARQEERTHAIAESQLRQERMIELLLQNQQQLLKQDKLK